VNARTASLSLVAALLISPLPLRAQSPVNAGASAMQIWADNVFGTEPSPSDGITDGRGWLSWRPAASLRLGANGRLVRFQDNPNLNHGYLTVMAETISGSRGSQARWQAGLSNAWRLNADLYEPFNYRDTSGYLSARYYLTPAFSTQLRADVSARAYPDQVSEDSRKVWLTARLQRSLPTRTSVTLALRAGWKDYVDGGQTDAAVRDVNLQAAQSLNARLALRTWWSNSHLYEHGDAAEQMAAFDNPLLDEFSFDGDRLGVSLKVIMPWNLVAELSGERSWLDYPGRPPTVYDPLANTFAVSGEEGDELVLADGERSDAVTRLRLGLQRRGTRLWGESRLDLNAAAEWNDQESNDLYWQWHGWSVQAGASVEF
jgi:hypothetical protein